MNVKFYVVLLLIVLAVGISQKEVFAPITSMENSNNGTMTKTISTYSGSSISQNTSEFIVPIILGIMLVAILIYFLKIKDDRKSDMNLSD